MPFKLQLGDNPVLVIVCCILVLIVFTFFVILYVSDYRDNRRKARNKQKFERAVERSRNKRQKQH